MTNLGSTESSAPQKPITLSFIAAQRSEKKQQSPSGVADRGGEALLQGLQQNLFRLGSATQPTGALCHAEHLWDNISFLVPCARLSPD